MGMGFSNILLIDGPCTLGTNSGPVQLTTANVMGSFISDPIEGIPHVPVPVPYQDLMENAPQVAPMPLMDMQGGNHVMTLDNVLGSVHAIVDDNYLIRRLSREGPMGNMVLQLKGGWCLNNYDPGGEDYLEWVDFYCPKNAGWMKLWRQPAIGDRSPRFEIAVGLGEMDRGRVDQSASVLWSSPTVVTGIEYYFLLCNLQEDSFQTALRIARCVFKDYPGELGDLKLGKTTTIKKEGLLDPSFSLSKRSKNMSRLNMTSTGTAKKDSLSAGGKAAETPLFLLNAFTEPSDGALNVEFSLRRPLGGDVKNFPLGEELLRFWTSASEYIKTGQGDPLAGLG